MDDKVTQTECNLRHANIGESLERIDVTIDKYGNALYGPDGTGGMQHRLTEVHNSLDRIEESINGHTTYTTKKTVALITGTLALIGPVIIVIVQAMFKRAGWI